MRVAAVNCRELSCELLVGVWPEDVGRRPASIELPRCLLELIAVVRGGELVVSSVFIVYV